LAENLLGYVDWIPQRLEVQFFASHGESLPGTAGYIHEGSYALSVSNTTATEKQTANGSEGTIFRKGFSSIYQRFSFLVASSVMKLIRRKIPLACIFSCVL
jgi:ribosome biogenesis protein UTP30